MLILGFEFLDFSVAASIPSLRGILVYKERRSKETRWESSLTWSMASIFLMKSVVSLT